MASASTMMVMMMITTVTMVVATITVTAAVTTSATTTLTTQAIDKSLNLVLSGLTALDNLTREAESLPERG